MDWHLKVSEAVLFAPPLDFQVRQLVDQYSRQGQWQNTPLDQ